MTDEILLPKLNPKYDVVFLSLFGDRNDPELLLSLLNALLQGHQPPLVSLELSPTRLSNEVAQDKAPVLDLCATDGQGRRYDVEIQVSRKAAYPERALYYWARLFVSQLKKGQPYTALRPTVGIHLLDWNLFDGPDQELHHVFHAVDERWGRRLTDHLALHILELPRFDRAIAELSSDEDKWLYFIRKGHTMTHDEAKALGHPIDKAEQRLCTLSQEQDLRIQAILQERRLHDEAAFLPDHWEEAHRKGRKQGLADGRKEGLADGRKEAMGVSVRLWERALGRALSQDERALLEAFARTTGIEALGDMALDMEPVALEGWLKAR